MNEKIGDIEGKLTEVKRKRYTKLQKARLSRDMYNGRQYSFLESNRLLRPTDNDLRDLKLPVVVMNFVKRSVHAFMAMFGEKQPQYYVSARNNSAESKNSARCADDFSHYLTTKGETVRKDNKNNYSLAVDGESFQMIEPHIAGKEPVKMPILDPETGELAGEEEVYLDPVEITLENYTIFELFYPPEVESEREWPWFFIEKFYHKDQAKLKFPEFAKDIDEMGGESDDAIDRKPHDKDSIRVVRFMERPGVTDPRGRDIIYSGDLVLNEGPWPFVDQRKEDAPWVVKYIVDFDETDGQGIVEPVTKIQKIINLTWSVAIDNMIKTMGKKLVHSDNITIQADDISNLPSTIPVPTGEEFTLSWLADPGVSFDVWKALDGLYSAFDEIIGIQGLTRGKEPEARMAKVGMQYLTERDLKKWQPVFDAYEEKKRQLLMFWLKAYRKYSPQVVHKVIKPSRGIELQDFMMDDFDDDDIQVERASSQPESKAGRTELAVELATQGAFRNQDGSMQIEFYEMLGTSSAKEIIRRQKVQLELAQKENELIIKGETVKVSLFHDHAVHIKEHSGELNGINYLSVAGTPAEDGLNEHINEHRLAEVQMAMEEQQMQMQVQMMMGMQPPPQSGPGGEPPAPEPPM